MVRLTRRQMLTLGGTAMLGALAGCSAGGGKVTYTGTKVSVPSNAKDYLSNVSNFHGEAIDLTDESEVEVIVGERGNGSFYAFGPPAIEITTGTTVVWKWNGKGGAHNVAAEDDTFYSGPSIISSSETFEHTFEESGLYRYYCTPHKANGMKGVVIVE